MPVSKPSILSTFFWLQYSRIPSSPFLLDQSLSIDRSRLNRNRVHECVGSLSLGTPQLLTAVAPCGRRLLLPLCLAMFVSLRSVHRAPLARPCPSKLKERSRKGCFAMMPRRGSSAIDGVEGLSWGSKARAKIFTECDVRGSK